ncbi:hypothetical protein [Enterococcus faecalis]|uniref:DUF7736 domain-containing protein n=1 Tax=Enterococcus faecalis TaxID=1351 RepID=UPI001D17AE33|nr:hypothetical protein [Enterococcus faecalis]MCC4085386.1 hypothetical protein [Enterococcus faecalis]
MSMTEREKIILSAYTGVSLTKDFNAIHKYIEEKLDRPVLIHEFATPEFIDVIREKCKEDFLQVINE